MKNNTQLIFVYNATSGIFAGIKDLVHKSVSPKTYGCNLCGLTYSGVSMKGEWKDFVASLPIKTTFLHKDEFAKKYPQYSMTFYPSVFLKEDTTLREIISAEEINKQHDLEELKQLVNSKLSLFLSF